MERNIKNLWERNSEPIFGTITGKLASKPIRYAVEQILGRRWSVEQALAFIEEGAYSPEEMAKIAKRNVR